MLEDSSMGTISVNKTKRKNSAKRGSRNRCGAETIIGWVRCGDLGGLNSGCGTMLPVHRREEMYYHKNGVPIFKKAAVTTSRKGRD